jgi:hypothetical protein
MVKLNKKHHTFKRGGFNELNGDVVKALYTSYDQIYPSYKVGELRSFEKMHFGRFMRNRCANRRH